MPSKLFELDSTNFTTGASNWMSRKRDAWLAGGGNGDAMGRHTTRLVANKLYQSWRAYLGSQGKQGTTQELAAFIGRFYGPDNVSALSQKFPQVFPPGSGPPPGGGPPPPGGGPPPPGGGPPPPGGGPPPPPGGEPPGGAPATADDKKSYELYQRYLGRLRPILETPTPNGPAVLRAVYSMLRNFSNRSEKAKTWVRLFFRDKLSSYAQIVPELAQFTGKDPFSFAPQRRSRATPGAGPAPGAGPGAGPGPAPGAGPTPPGSDPSLSIPTAPNSPPDFLRRQKQESRQRRGQLIEAPAAAPNPLAIPPMVNPGTNSRGEPKGSSFYSHPPQFMRQQSNGPAPAAAPVVLNRALADQIFVELARMMIDNGEANVGPRQNGSGGDTGGGGGGGGRDTGGGGGGGRRSTQARISWNAMQLGAQKAGQVNSHDMAAIQQVIQAAPNQALTIPEIIAALGKNNHGTLQTSTVLALLYASQYT